MELKLTCKNCRERIKVKSEAPSRYDLENEKGRYFYHKCPKCHIEDEYHVNEVSAEGGNIRQLMYILFAVGLSLTLILFFLGMNIIALISIVLPFFVYNTIKKSNEKSIELFNNHKVSRTRS